MRCPFCGYDNKDENSQTCSFCNKPLNEKPEGIIKTVYVKEEKPKVERQVSNTTYRHPNYYIKQQQEKEAKMAIGRNSLGYINLNTRWFHHIIYACGAYLLMYVLYFLIARILVTYYQAQGVDFSGIATQTAPVEVELLYTKISAMAQAFAELGVVGATIFIFRKKIKEFFNEFKQGNTYKWYAIGFGLLYGMNIVYSVILMVLNVQSDTNVNQESVQQIVRQNPLLGVLFVVVAAPLFEELVFRLGIFRAFTNSNDKKKNKALEITGLVITTILFALIHMVATFEAMAAEPETAMALLKNDLIALPSYLIGAFALTFTYYKSKSLASTMMVHMTWNTLSVIAIFSKVTTTAIVLSMLL